MQKMRLLASFRLVEKRVQEICNEDSCDIVDPRALSPLNRSRNRKSERKKGNNVASSLQPKVNILENCMAQFNS